MVDSPAEMDAAIKTPVGRSPPTPPPESVAVIAG